MAKHAHKYRRANFSFSSNIRKCKNVMGLWAVVFHSLFFWRKRKKGMFKENNNRKKKTIIIGTVVSLLYAALKWIAKRHGEVSDIDRDNPYLENEKEAGEDFSGYVKLVKPFIDQALSFVALVLLFPLFIIIAFAIYLEDPGPVFFSQIRVGKDKHFFILHKFRSMFKSAPHNIPTHQLSTPDQYITKVGKVLRRTSLDELPQIWDIFRGCMSVIGPRPALWNQKDLVEQREIYGANNVMPGLTGWAQINGRDELEIPVKSALDGEYVDHLRRGGMKAFLFDLKCFMVTVKSVVSSKGVVEGGTGKLAKKETIRQIKNEEILVSVITPAYNASGYLEECIDSVLAQSYGNWEMIIVDDHSSDDTYRIAEKYAEKDNRIKIIQHERNCGVAAARNTALEAAKGDYIAFLDSDDLWNKDKLYKQLCFMEENIYAISYTSYQKVDAFTNKKGKIIRIPKVMTYEKIFGNTAIACLTVMVNRKAVGDFYMPQLDHTEDQCTWQDILNRGYVAYGLNENLAYYREGNISLTNDKKNSTKKQWNTYRDYYKFGILRSAFYFTQYIVNAVIKHM